MIFFACFLIAAVICGTRMCTQASYLVHLLLMYKLKHVYDMHARHVCQEWQLVCAVLVRGCVHP